MHVRGTDTEVSATRTGRPPCHRRSRRRPAGHERDAAAAGAGRGAARRRGAPDRSGHRHGHARAIRQERRARSTRSSKAQPAAGLSSSAHVSVDAADGVRSSGPRAASARPVSIVTERDPPGRHGGAASSSDVNVGVASMRRCGWRSRGRVRVVVQIVPGRRRRSERSGCSARTASAVSPAMWPLDPPTSRGSARRSSARCARPAGPDRRRPRHARIRRVDRARAGARRARPRAPTSTSAGVVPTPAVAYLAGALDFDLGVVLSASHNPYARQRHQGVLRPRREVRRGRTSARSRPWWPTRGWTVAGRAAARASNAAARRRVPRHTFGGCCRRPGRCAGARIAVDMANGATTTTARARCSRRSGSSVVALGDAPDGRNINLACGSTHPASLAAAVGRRQAAGSASRSTATATARSSSTTAASVVDGDAVLLMLALALPARGPADGRHGRRHRDEQHRPRDRARETRHPADSDAGRRQVRDGRDARAAATCSAASSRVT